MTAADILTPQELEAALDSMVRAQVDLERAVPLTAREWAMVKGAGQMSRRHWSLAGAGLDAVAPLIVTAVERKAQAEGVLRAPRM